MSIDEVLKSELITNAKNLAGATLVIQESMQIDADGITPVDNACCVYLSIEGEDRFDALLYITPQIATSISSLMLEAKADPKKDIENSDIEALKNFFDTLATSATNTLHAESMDIRVSLSEIKKIDITTIANKYSYIEKIDFEFKDVILEEHSFYILSSDSISSNQERSMSPRANSSILSEHTFSKKELQNLNLILDVKIEIKVRIGSKKMFLKDAINMDIGSVVELDRLLNEPLDILVDNKIIGHGDVVIVDGNFGIRVTDIVDSVTRLESLREQ